MARKKVGKQSDGGAPAPQPASPVTPSGSARPSDPDDPPLDPRFMPNAAAAVALAGRLRNWKARLVSLRTEVRAAFPDRDGVMARRLDVGLADATLTDLVETLDRNVPECVCPTCCGTGTDDEGRPDKFCDGYGVIDRHHHAGLKVRWKRTRDRLAALVVAPGGEGE